MITFFWYHVAKLIECCWDVAWYVYIHGSLVVVLTQSHAKVVLSFLVHYMCLMFLKGVDKVFEVFFSDVFDTKAIDN